MEKIITYIRIPLFFIFLKIYFCIFVLVPQNLFASSTNPDNYKLDKSEIKNHDFTFAVVQYQGGDWYQGKVGVKNLMNFINEYKIIKCNPTPKVITLEDVTLSEYPFLYLTGHDKIKLSPIERNQLYRYLIEGGFLYVNDDYGLAKSFEEEISLIFPNQKWQDLPSNHSLFSIYHSFPEGTPKIHEHDGGSPQTRFLAYNERIIILYTRNTDIGDGWANYRVHKNNKSIREQALRFGMNVIIYSLVQ